jgi:hypothetical protein
MMTNGHRTARRPNCQIRSRTGRKNATSIKNDSARGLGQASWYPGVGMSVYPFLREAVFEPEIIQVMAGA